MLPPSLKTERAKLDDFYAARSEAIPPLPWQTFPPPFSSSTDTRRMDHGGRGFGTIPTEFEIRA
jgi:hypothetical protein